MMACAHIALRLRSPGRRHRQCPVTGRQIDVYAGIGGKAWHRDLRPPPRGELTSAAGLPSASWACERRELKSNSWGQAAAGREVLNQLDSSTSTNSWQGDKAWQSSGDGVQNLTSGVKSSL